MSAPSYRAFISYSQKDKAFARSLHRWLETYRLPKGITAAGVNNRRLGRFFRDNDELSASPDVGMSLRGALDESESLIVVCSPNSAASKWVNSEVSYFQETHPERKVLAVIVGGAPQLAGSADECFPPALRINAAGSHGMAVEPLGLDVRQLPRRRLRAMLVAGLLGLRFDDLWQRERQRQRIRLLQLCAGVLVATAVIAGLIWRAMTMQQLAQEQQQRVAERDRNATLAQVSSSIGENETAALDRLRTLLGAKPGDAAVSSVARVVLSWMTPASETMGGFPDPRFWIVGNRLMLKNASGVHDVGDAQPERRVGFTGGRVLLIYPDRLVVVNRDTGRTLHVLDASSGDNPLSYEWNGVAFESTDGTALLVGAHGGVSNGQIWHTLLVIAPDGTVSLLAPRDHPGARDDSWRSSFIYELFVAPDCRTLAVLDNNRQEGLVPTTQSKFEIDIDHGARFAGTATAMEGGVLPTLPRPNDQSGVLQITSERSIKERGCVPPDFDTFGRTTLTGLGGLVLRADPAFSPAQPPAWRKLPDGPANEYEADAAYWTARPIAGPELKPCGATTPCAIVDGRWKGESFEAEAGNGPGWTQSAMPPAGLSDGEVKDEFARQPLFTFHEGHNAGIESAWCRQQGARHVCLTSRVSIDYQLDLSDVDLRSRSGRYVYYSMGISPFEVFNVQVMRVATPAGHTVVSRPGAAAFSDAPDDRLFVFSSERLQVFEPAAQGGAFQDVSQTLTWNGRLAGIAPANPVVGLIADPSDDLIVALQDGSVVRFKWKTGQIVWTRSLVGLGKVVAFRRSSKDSYAAVVGSLGIRVLRTEDGLLSSGLLVPPYVFDTSFRLKPCDQSYGDSVDITDAMTDITVGDTGTLTMQCGRARFAWTPQLPAGDLRDRLTRLSQR